MRITYSQSGEVNSFDVVYIVDGASLSALPSKSHTFRIMANADRIAHGVAKLLVNS